VFLLDTNVISELRKAKPHGAVLAWAQAQAAESLFLSAVTVGEIQTGIERTRDINPAKAAELETWLEEVIAARKVLPMDANSFRILATLMYRRANDHFVDGMIAATAIAHGLTVATRNVADFQPFGVPHLNPFEFGRP